MCHTRLSFMTIILAIAISIFFSSSVIAQSTVSEEVSSSVELDVEVDPIAYAFSGHSLHAGLGFNRFRIDLGVFAMKIPSSIHGNDKFTSNFNGFGAKFDVYLDTERTGFFAGIETGYVRTSVILKRTENVLQNDQFNLGGRLGWRFDIAAGLYISPWIGVGYALGAPEKFTIEEETFENNSLLIFPTVHLGYRAF